MKTKGVIQVLALGMAWGAATARAQTAPIQPSPAYYQSGAPVYYTPAAPAVQPAAAPPVYYAPAPGTYYAPAAPQPVYYSPQPAPQLTLAPPPAEVDEEEGLYWFWGQKWPGLALGAKIGTLGVGGELVFGINRFLNLRSGANYGPFSTSLTLGDVKYDAELDMLSIPLLVDLHPFGGHFRITGGVLIQPGTEATLTSTPTRNTQIGNHTYAPDVIGTLNGTIEVSDTLTPYLGIGFGNAVAEDQLLTFMLDLGVVFQSYDFKLTSNGAGMTTKLDTFRVDLEKEEDSIQSDLDSFKVYPVLSIGLAFHF